MVSNIVIIGSSGAIGNALTNRIALSKPNAVIHAFSRKLLHFSHDNVVLHEMEDYSEQSIEASVSIVANHLPLDWVIVATGMLHDGEIAPEKSLQDLSADKFQHVFLVNTILPAIVAKYYLPKLNRQRRSIFAALSARVGSISDNRLGGWYAYRASKAALNMIIKNAAIEIARLNKQAVVVGLHPGTVDSRLSKPFQGNVPDGKLFTPDYSARKLIEVLNHLMPFDSGKCFAWDGKEVEP